MPHTEENVKSMYHFFCIQGFCRIPVQKGVKRGEDGLVRNNKIYAKLMRFDQFCYRIAIKCPISIIADEEFIMWGDCVCSHGLFDAKISWPVPLTECSTPGKQARILAQSVVEPRHQRTVFLLVRNYLT